MMNQTMVAPYIPDARGGVVNSYEDCLNPFESDDKPTPLTEAQEAIYAELAETLSKFNANNANALCDIGNEYIVIVERRALC